MRRFFSLSSVMHGARKEFALNLSALLTDLIAAPASHWWAYAGGLAINCAVTAAIAWHYGAMVGRVAARVTEIEDKSKSSFDVDEDVSSIQKEMAAISGFAADLQCDLDTLRETVTSQIVSKVLVSQEIVIARMTEAMAPIDTWRAKNDLEFVRLLENWDELRRWTEDELLTLKAAQVNQAEREKQLVDAILSANNRLHSLQQNHNREAELLHERISAFQAEDTPSAKKPSAKKKPSKAKAKKHG